MTAPETVSDAVTAPVTAPAAEPTEPVVETEIPAVVAAEPVTEAQVVEAVAQVVAVEPVVEPIVAPLDPNDVEGHLATQPEDSSVEYVGGAWHFYRGAGRGSHGQGRTLASAIRAVNSSYVKAPNSERLIHVDEFGEPLPPD